MPQKNKLSRNKYLSDETVAAEMPSEEPMVGMISVPIKLNLSLFNLNLPESVLQEPVHSRDKSPTRQHK